MRYAGPMDWNVVVTVRPGFGHEHALLGALARFGQFRGTSFRDVCVGRVDDVDAFLDAVRDATAEGRPWTGLLARVVPAETVLTFAPEALAALLAEAVEPLVERMTDGSFCVRLERRGLAGKVASTEVERALADRVYDLAAARGVRLRTDLEDPDFLIAAETLGEQCGLALLPRAMRERWPFVQTR